RPETATPARDGNLRSSPFTCFSAENRRISNSGLRPGLQQRALCRALDALIASTPSQDTQDAILAHERLSLPVSPAAAGCLDGPSRFRGNSHQRTREALARQRRHV